MERQAPKILRWLNRKGVPYLAVVAVITLCCLAYLALGSGSTKVLNWILNFCIAATMMNWLAMTITWILFYGVMKAQGSDSRTFLPVVSRFQPYAGW